MSLYFNLPATDLIRSLISNGCIDSNCDGVGEYEAAELAISSYDANQALITNQAEQIKVLRSALDAVVKVNHTHGGSLGFSGHFYYKVSENVFKLCDKALEATKPVEE